MKLFGKKKEKVKSCCCGGNGTPEVMAQAEAEAGRSGSRCWGLAAPNVTRWRRPPARL